MTPRTYQVPQGRAVDDNGRLVPVWHTYLAGLGEVSQRVAAPVEPLDAGASLADVIAKVNEIVAALEAARLLRET